MAYCNWPHNLFDPFQTLQTLYRQGVIISAPRTARVRRSGGVRGIDMLRALFLFLCFSMSSIVLATPVTGPFAADAVLAIKPQLITDTSGVRYWDVPVVRSGVTGVATIAEDYAVGRVLAASRLGTIGLSGAVAVEAVKGVAGMCIWQTDKWHDCTQRPTIPINIDTSKITAATSKVNAFYAISAIYVSTSCGVICTSSDVIDALTRTLKARPDLGTSFQSYTLPAYNGSSIQISTNLGNPVLTVIPKGTIYTTYSCSSGTLTNSIGAPMAVTGQFCTPDSAYTCSTNYFRSDSSGNIDSAGLFCSYTSPVYDDTQAAKLLAPYLLDYYANQLFTGKDGKPLDVFSAPNTTFDPAASPSTMPMTLDQLKQYVDWVRNGTAQTTDPLAPHYISPNNYDYTKNYINTNNTTNVTNNTSSATSTITPEQTASSAAMTQSQFEDSTKKMDKASADAINATDTSSLNNLAGGSGGFNNANDQLNDISNGHIADLPSVPLPQFPTYSQCRTVNLSWNSVPAVFPTPSQCQKLEEGKKALGYLLYLMTFVGIILELLRRVE